MLNQVKSSFTSTTPHSEARALVEAFAKQDKQRLYPFELQNFSLGVKFKNGDLQVWPYVNEDLRLLQRDIGSK